MRRFCSTQLSAAVPCFFRRGGSLTWDWFVRRSVRSVAAAGRTGAVPAFSPHPTPDESPQHLAACTSTLVPMSPTFRPTPLAATTGRPERFASPSRWLAHRLRYHTFVCLKTFAFHLIR